MTLHDVPQKTDADVKKRVLPPPRCRARRDQRHDALPIRAGMLESDGVSGIRAWSTTSN